MPMSAAELKAKFAKYAQPQGVSNVSSKEAQASQLSVPQAEGTERAEATGRDASVVSINGNARVAGSSGAVGDSESSGATSPSIPAVVQTVETNQTIRTDLQPAALVVVERPAVGDSGVSDSLRGGDLQSSEASTDLDVGNPVHQGFLQRLHDLETALLDRDPLMKTHLAEIHKALIQYEEITNLLRPEEIAKIMAAQQVHTNMILTKEVVKKTAASTRAKVAKIGMDDV